MANTFNRSVTNISGTVASTIYTVPALTKTIFLGLLIGNTSASVDPALDVYVTISGVDYYLCKGTSLPVGLNLDLSGDNGKLVLAAADALKVKCNTASSAVSVIASYLEIA